MRNIPEKSDDSLVNLTSGKVERKVFLETIQHPATIFPAAMAAVSVLYMALISFSPQSFSAMFLFGAVSAGSWVFNYFIRGEKLGAQYVQRLREAREQNMTTRASRLAEECSYSNFEEGEKQINELEEAYAKLRAYLLEKVRVNNSINAERFLALAQDTHDQGVAILQAAFEAHQAIHEIDMRTLLRERDSLQKERKRASDSESILIDAKIESHSKIIELYNEQERRINQLLAECERLESALKSAYLQVTVSESGVLETIATQGRVASSLEQAVNAARLVEQKIRALGGNSAAEDQEYLSAGLNSAQTRGGGTGNVE